MEGREKARESKALTAARLEKSLERELIARLKSRAYGDQPLNINEDVWKAVLNREKEKELELEDLEMESDDSTDEEESDENDELEEEGEFISDLEESDLEDMEEYLMDGQEVSLLFRASLREKYVDPRFFFPCSGILMMMLELQTKVQTKAQNKTKMEMIQKKKSPQQLRVRERQHLWIPKVKVKGNQLLRSQRDVSHSYSYHCSINVLTFRSLLFHRTRRS